MEELGIEEARAKLGDLVLAAQQRGEVTAITRYDRPAAVLVNPDWYESAISLIGEFRPHLGRFEVVHKDGDPRNNDPSNLELRERPQ